MEITQAQSTDLPEMIRLLKDSLGESLIPKSEAYFLWKHDENVFGKSKILLAREDQKIIGLRAFMKWNWVNGDDMVFAVRAVDTATDPAHQGKGIFRKLTMQAVEECKAEGIGLVFNSPNDKSRPGYLKMGWQQEGKMPLLLGIGSIFPKMFSEERNQKVYGEFNSDAIMAMENHNLNISNNTGKYITPLSKSYLKWRYHDCPVAQYGCLIEPGKFGIVFRLKKLSKFTELRICEVWEEGSGHAIALKKGLTSIIRSSRPLMVSCAPTPLIPVSLGLHGPFKAGPVTTIRPLAKGSLTEFEKFASWQPSIGSMELF